MAARPSFSLSIAGVRIEVDCPLAPDELGIVRRLGPFLGASEPPAARLALRWEEAAEVPVPRGAVIYDPGSVWRLHRHGGELEASIEYPAGPRALLVTDDRWTGFRLIEKRDGPRWQSVLRTGATELILRTAILSAGGLVLHAAGVDDRGRGIVFVGRAGAGKSTQARLWGAEPGVVALSDDRIAVRLDGGDGARCYGTPWGGTIDIARNHSAPLAALVLLEQAAENRLVGIPPAEAAPLLLARAFLPYWDGALMALAARNLEEILLRAPVYRLRCRPEPAVIPLLRAGV